MPYFEDVGSDGTNGLQNVSKSQKFKMAALTEQTVYKIIPKSWLIMHNDDESSSLMIYNDKESSSLGCILMLNHH